MQSKCSANITIFYWGSGDEKNSISSVQMQLIFFKVFSVELVKSRDLEPRGTNCWMCMDLRSFEVYPTALCYVKY